MEIINIDDKYRYHNPPDHDDDYSTREDTRIDKTASIETTGYVNGRRYPENDRRTDTERRTDRTEEEYSLYEDRNGRPVNGGPRSDHSEERTDRLETEERLYYPVSVDSHHDKRRRTSDTRDSVISDSSSRRGPNQSNGYPSGKK